MSDGLAETERLHSEDCRRQEEQRSKEADELARRENLRCDARRLLDMPPVDIVRENGRTTVTRRLAP